MNAKSLHSRNKAPAKNKPQFSEREIFGALNRIPVRGAESDRIWFVLASALAAAAQHVRVCGPKAWLPGAQPFRFGVFAGGEISTPFMKPERRKAKRRRAVA
jgi:hypothetical protein